MRISGAAYRKVPAVRADEKWSAMVAKPTSATFADPSAVSRMLLVFTSLGAAAERVKGEQVESGKVLGPHEVSPANQIRFSSAR